MALTRKNTALQQSINFLIPKILGLDDVCCESSIAAQPEKKESLKKNENNKVYLVFKQTDGKPLKEDKQFNIWWQLHNFKLSTQRHTRKTYFSKTTEYISVDGTLENLLNVLKTHASKEILEELEKRPKIFVQSIPSTPLIKHSFLAEKPAHHKQNNIKQQQSYEKNPPMGPGCSIQ